jgi:hypothetical protein
MPHLCQIPPLNFNHHSSLFLQLKHLKIASGCQVSLTSNLMNGRKTMPGRFPLKRRLPPPINWEERLWKRCDLWLPLLTLPSTDNVSRQPTPSERVSSSRCTRCKRTRSISHFPDWSNHDVRHQSFHRSRRVNGDPVPKVSSPPQGPEQRSKRGRLSEI